MAILKPRPALAFTGTIIRTARETDYASVAAYSIHIDDNDAFRQAHLAREVVTLRNGGCGYGTPREAVMGAFEFLCLHLAKKLDGGYPPDFMPACEIACVVYEGREHESVDRHLIRLTFVPTSGSTSLLIEEGVSLPLNAANL